MKRRPQLPLLRPAARPQREFEPLDAVIAGIVIFVIIIAWIMEGA